MIDPHVRLIAGLQKRADAASMVVRASSQPWASATFAGARHTIRLALPPAAAEALAADIERQELTIPGHIVADILITGRILSSDRVTLEIEALTIEGG